MTRGFSVFGDSISTFLGVTLDVNVSYYPNENRDLTHVLDVSDTWWMQVIDSLGGHLVANASYSGSMVEGMGFPACSSKARAQQVMGKDGECPDDILIFAGINDYGWGSSTAQAEAKANAVPDCLDLSKFTEKIAGIAPKNAAERFFFAYKQMLENIREVAPTSRLWCITLLPGRAPNRVKSSFCYRFRGASFDSYNAAISMAAKLCGANLLDIESAGYDYSSIDGTHPNAQGMKQIAALVYAALEERLLSEEELRLFDDHLSSGRYCFKNNCIGCEFATSTVNRWSLVCNEFSGDTI